MYNYYMWPTLKHKLNNLIEKKAPRSVGYLKSGKKEGYGRALGLMFEQSLRSNPYLVALLKAKKHSAQYYGAFQRMIAKDNPSPSSATFKKVMEITKKQEPIELIEELKYDGQKIIDTIEQQPIEVQEELIASIESDANEVPLSSSWLAYGTFISSPKNEKRGKIYMTTKKGKQFRTGVVNISIWEKMKKQIGVTIYKKGKRYGSSYGSGTILCKYVPRKTWRKVKKGEWI